jgi:hypothetical protein
MFLLNFIQQHMTFSAEAPLSSVHTITCSETPSCTPTATVTLDYKEVYDCIIKPMDDSVRAVSVYGRTVCVSVTLGCDVASLRYCNRRFETTKLSLNISINNKVTRAAFRKKIDLSTPLRNPNRRIKVGAAFGFLRGHCLFCYVRTLRVSTGAHPFSCVVDILLFTVDILFTEIKASWRGFFFPRTVSE